MEEAIKRAVQEYYAGRARQGAACCGEGQIAFLGGLYPKEETSSLPEEVKAAAAGCGDPLALGDLKAGEVVVDLGSGGGIDCFRAAQKVGPRGRVIGVDFTPEMVALAQHNARRLGLSWAEFVLADLERLPLPEGSADVVISNCVINLVPDKGRAFREAFRILRRGGRLYLTDVVAQGELPAEIREDPQVWSACIAGAEREEAYVGRLVAAGFADVQVTRWGGECAEGACDPWVYSVAIRAYKR